MSLILVLVQVAVVIVALAVLAWHSGRGGLGPGRKPESVRPVTLWWWRRETTSPEKQKVVIRRRGRRARVKATAQTGLVVDAVEEPAVQELEPFRDPFSGPGSYDGALPTKSITPQQRWKPAQVQAVHDSEPERPGTRRG